MENLDTTPEAVSQPIAGKYRRRVLWTLAALLLLLALVLTPPLVTVNRLHRRIAASMSASLGRPVHLDRVHLHLLPVPGLTLENLVVSEDPAFGYEPTIRANVVEVTLRSDPASCRGACAHLDAIAAERLCPVERGIGVGEQPVGERLQIRLVPTR